MEAHNEAVAAISKRLQEFYARGAAFRVYHGSTNSTRAIHKDADSVVDTSGLNRVLGVDRARKTALVEPNVPMDALVAATLEAGLVPLVVMEFPGITAGGGFSGSAGESSSGRHGPFDATVDEIEIVVPDGAVLRASPRGGGGGGGGGGGPASGPRRPDLFWGAASAFGTVGVVTLLEVRLRDAAPYVRLAHYPLASFADAERVLQERVADPAVEFVDGVAFSPAELVVCAGALADHLPPGVKPRRYLGRGDPWFYLDVRRRVMKKNKKKKKKGKKGKGTGDVVVDYVPLTDYLFRWDRGGFWVARHAFRYFFTPFNRATRYALDRFMHARVMYHALHASALSDAYVIQDVGVPFAGAADFYAWVDATLGIRPVWLCPIRVRRDAGGDAAHGLHASFADPDATPEVLLNFGIWGPGPRDPAERLRLNRLLEREVHARGGNKTLYAQAFYTEDEFWRAYDRPAYDAVRRRYHADHLPSVYDKVVAKVDEGGVVKRHGAARSRMPAALRERRPFQGLYGVYKAWRGGDYLLRKKAPAATAAGEPERAS